MNGQGMGARVLVHKLAATVAQQGRRRAGWPSLDTVAPTPVGSTQLPRTKRCGKMLKSCHSGSTSFIREHKAAKTIIELEQTETSNPDFFLKRGLEV